MATVRRNDVWRLYLAVSVVLVGAYAVLALAGAPESVTVAVYRTAIPTGLAGMLLGIRLHRPASRWPWMMVAGLVLAVIGGTFPPAVAMGGTAPAGVADVLFLSSYLILAYILIHIARRRSPELNLPAMVDAGIITVSAILLSWVYLVGPLLGDNGVDLTTRLVAAAYPLGDLMLASLGVRLLMGDGPKPPAVYILTAYLTLIIVPDTMTVALTLAGNDALQAVIYLLWMASALLLGLLGLHPSMRDIDVPRSTGAPDVGPLRLTVLAIASLLAPVTLFVQYLRGAPLHIPLICACCCVLFLLVIARLAGLVTAQRRMAITDGLTGLRTRRFFQQRLNAVTQPTRSVSVLLLDVDHFKRVNDTYGHDGGDRVLREIAERLSRATRPDDVVARYGGEEFAILLPRTTTEEACRVAERVHAAVRDTPVSISPAVAIPVTVSVGVACQSADVADPDRLVLRADEALYRAKDDGRDRIAVAEPAPVH
jgi:two-component system cell cycle response regulator